MSLSDVCFSVARKDDLGDIFVGLWLGCTKKRRWGRYGVERKVNMLVVEYGLEYVFF
jgi:hypothetical protein